MPKLPRLNMSGLSSKSGAKSAANAAQSNVAQEYINQHPEFGVDLEGAQEAADLYSPEMQAKIEKDLELERKYGNKPIEAFAEGALRGLLPGADQVLTRGFGMSPERIQGVKEHNETPAAAGELTTLIGGAALSGGENALAKFTVGGAMAGAEKEIAAKIAKDVFKNTAEKNIFQNIISKGVAAGVSGAGYGTNQLLNENALGKADLTGENFLSYAGTGAALNGLVGGAFGGIEAAAPLVKTAAESATGQLKRQVSKLIDPVVNASEILSDSASGRSDILDKAAEMGKDKFLKSLSDDLGLRISSSSEDLYKNTKQFLKDSGEQIENIYKVVDSTNPQGIISTLESKAQVREALGNFVEKFANEFDSKAAKTVLNNALETIENRFARVGEQESATDLWNWARSLGKQGKAGFADGVDAKLAARINAHLYGTVKNILEDSIDKVTTGTAQEGLLPQLKDLNQRWRLADTIEPHLEKRAVAKTNFLDFKSSVLGTAGAVAGGPAGAAAAVMGSKFLNSDLRRRIMVLNSMERANSEALKKVTSSIKYILGTGAKAGSEVIKALPKSSLMYSGLAVNEKRQSPKNDKEAFKNIQNSLVLFKTNPEQLLDKVAASTLKASYVAPNATKAAQTAMVRGINFLYDKMPKDMNHGTDITGKREWEPSSVEMAKFKRYVQAVEHPYSVLTDLEKGTLTREHVEALQAVYPAIYEQIRDVALGEVQKSPMQVPYNRKVQLGILLNSATDASMRPQTVMELQSNFQTNPQQQGGAVKTTARGVAGINKSDRLTSGMQEASQGIEE